MDEIAASHSSTPHLRSNPLATTACVTALDKVLTPELFPRVTALGDAWPKATARSSEVRPPLGAVNHGANGTSTGRKTPPTNYREWLDQTSTLLALLAHEPERA
jgi:hypothetical protein